MPLVAGIRLGNCEIPAPLGAGGMGEVCRARDTQQSCGSVRRDDRPPAASRHALRLAAPGKPLEKMGLDG